MSSNLLSRGVPLLLLLMAHGNTEPPPPLRTLVLAEDAPGTIQKYGEGEVDSLRKESSPTASVTLSDETRIALVGRPNGRISFTVTLPPLSLLRFGIAAATCGKSESGIGFRLFVRSSSGREQVFEEWLGPEQQNRWLDRTLDLARWSGTTIALEFQTVIHSPANAEHSEEPLPLWGHPVVTGGSRAAKPNLILITVDCLRADHVGSYGYGKPTTPNIDRWAAGSTVFESAVTSSSWTIPAHYSMLTGLSPSGHGVSGYVNEFWTGHARKLGDTVPYLPEVLSRAGYSTMAAVSSDPLSATYGFDRGFSVHRVTGPQSDVVVDNALELAERSGDRPLFLWVHLIDPHAPYLPKVAFDGYSRKFIEPFGFRPVNVSGLLEIVGDRRPPSSPEDVSDVARLYDAAIAYADNAIGRLFQGLEAQGMLQRSAVILTSDHGESFYEHGRWQHGETLYDEVIRVPLIVRWSDHRVRSRVETQVNVMDIFPTFLEAAGIEVLPSEGESLLSLAGGALRSRQTVSEVTAAPGDVVRTLIAFRDLDWKYIATLRGGFGEASSDEVLAEELYRLADDPAETRNVARERLDIVESFRRRLRSHLELGREARAHHKPGAPAVPNSETLRALKTIGYVN